jgi:hypothetical protein
VLRAFVLVAALGGPTPEDTGRALEIVVDDNPCVDADAIRVGLVRTLEIELSNGGEATTIDVAVAPRTRGWDVELRASADGRALQRSLVVEDPACAELEAAIVLVGALLLDELWSSRATLHVQPDVAPAPAPVAPHRRVVASVAPAPERRPPWALRASAAARMSVGDLPGVAGGVALEWLATAPRVVSFGLQIVAWPYRGVEHAHFSAVDFAVPVCADAVRRAIWALSVCGAPRAGVAFVSGTDVSDPQGVVRPRLLVDAVVDARVRLVGPLWLRGHVGLTVPVLRDRFVIVDTNPSDPVEVVHRAWPVVPLAGLGLELRARLGGGRS